MPETASAQAAAPPDMAASNSASPEIPALPRAPRASSIPAARAIAAGAKPPPVPCACAPMQASALESHSQGIDGSRKCPFCNLQTPCGSADAPSTFSGRTATTTPLSCQRRKTRGTPRSGSARAAPTFSRRSTTVPSPQDWRNLRQRAKRACDRFRSDASCAIGSPWASLRRARRPR